MRWPGDRWGSYKSWDSYQLVFSLQQLNLASYISPLIFCKIGYVIDHTCWKETIKILLLSEICFTFLFSGCSIIKRTQVSLNLEHNLNISFHWRGNHKRKKLAKNPPPVKDFPPGKSQAIVCSMNLSSRLEAFAQLPLSAFVRFLM